MRWVALIVVGTLILDGLVYGLLRPGFLVVPVGLLVMVLVVVARGRRGTELVAGWSLV